jgi:hypothetical protein
MHKFMIMLICLSMLTFGTTAFAEDINYMGTGRFAGGLLYSSDKIITLSVDFDGIIFGIFGKNLSSTEEEETFGLDLGYSWKIHKYCRLGLEGSVATISNYDKYIDNNLSGNYYIVKRDNEIKFGVGLILAIPINKKFELIGSANSIKGIGGGLMIRW